MINLQTDIGDLILQRTLKTNFLGLNKTINSLTTGYKINNAKDNAAGYNIIDSLNTKISSMLVIQQNTAEGIDLMMTAEGGLENCLRLFERLRSLATQAANGTYDQSSLNSLQAEADSIVEQIEFVRNQTEYNGMNLFEKPIDTINTTAVANLAASASLTSEMNQTVYSAPKAYAAASPANAVPLSDTVEGSENFVSGQKKTIVIDGVSYTLKNLLSTVNSISYSKNTQTGEVTFIGNNMEIRGDLESSHNIIINGSNNTVYGGNYDDTFRIIGSVSYKNTIYGRNGNDTFYAVDCSNNNSLNGEAGDDIFETNISYTYLYGAEGNDTFNVKTSDCYIGAGAGNDIINITGNRNKINAGSGDDNITIASGTSNQVNGGDGANTITDNGTSTIKANVPGANASIFTFNAKETKVVEISGIKYEITNTLSSGNRSVIAQVDSNGFITFSGDNNYFEIKGQSNVAHKVILLAEGYTFYGGDLADTIYLNKDKCIGYGGKGDDTIQLNNHATIAYGGDGNDNLAVKGSCALAFGEAGNDTITLTGTSTYGQYAYGGAGDDNFIIKGNYSVVSGGAGSNTITGERASTISSGFGNDDENNGYLDLKVGQTQSVTIGGKTYTVTNTLSTVNFLSCNYNPVTGKVTFGGRGLNIKGDENVEHNIKIVGYSINLTTGNKADTIEDYGYYNVVHALGGDDFIDSYSNYSSIYAEDGDDTINIRGSIHAFGGAGNDKLNICKDSNRAPLEVNGGDGDDIYTIDYTGTVSDTNGNNIYYINCNNANIAGGAGNDTFYVKGQNNTVSGGAGNDYFVIDGDNNKIDGGTDNDVYVANTDNVNISNVNTDPNSGSISFTSKNEVKTFELNGKTYTVTNKIASAHTLKYSLNPNTGIITIEGSDFTIDSKLNQNANLNIRGSNNTINGSNLVDKITIETGSNNVVNALGGNDILTMDSKNNSLLGGEGNDTITLNASTNLQVDGGAGNDTLNIESSGNTKILAGSGDDIIRINGGNNNVTAGSGNNQININSDNNTVTAENGDNVIITSGSTNTLTAGTGNNKIGLDGDNNNLTIGNVVSDINILGNNNTVSNDYGAEKVLIRGDGNTYTAKNDKKDITVNGNNNIVTGSNENDIIKIKGDSNKVNAGIGNDTLTVLSGSQNNINGGQGDKNILVDRGDGTVYQNVLLKQTSPFDVNFKVDIGDDKNSFISATISFDTLGFSVDLTSQNSARASLEEIDSMISIINSELSRIGSTINRLESAAEYQTISIENMISSRSTLRDVDVAQESSNVIKFQILNQASIALMSMTRNLRAENVLGLLTRLQN